ncbi:hypothetical protein ACX0HA_16835 [Flavobacterium hauense]
MKAKKSISLALNIIYAITLLLFFMDWYTHVEIKNEALKFFAYWGLLVGTPVILLFNVLLLSKGIKKVTGIVIPVIVLYFIIVHNPVYILISKGNWKTQTILYQSNRSQNTKIELQINNRGAFGHNMRTVEVYYLTPFFTYVSLPEPHPEDNSDWTKVDIEVNEFKWRML